MTLDRCFTVIHAGVIVTFMGSAAAQVDPEPGRSATCAQPSQFGVEVFTNTVPLVGVQHRADAELAVGPCHVVAISNAGIKTYHKPGPAGTLDKRLSREDFSHQLPAFWAPVATQSGLSLAVDPQASYDALSGRFLASAVFQEWPTPSGPEGWYFALAVSKGSDPNPVGTEPAWWFYYVDMTSIVAGPSSIDRPTLSIDDDRVYINGHQGSLGSTSRVVVLDKSPLLNGTSPAVFTPVEEQVVDLTSSWTSLAVRYGPDDGSAQYVLNDELLGGTSASSIRFWAITRQTVPTSFTTTVAVPTYYKGSCAPQVGTPTTIRTDEAHILSAVYRNGSVWTVQSVRAGPGAVDPDVALVRWYEFAMNGWPDSGQTPTLRQTGVLDVPWPLYAYYPSIAVDSIGNAAITFNVSGEVKAVSMWQAFRCHSDPLNTFGIPFEIEAGLQAYEGASAGCLTINWGDYTGTEPDPVAGSLFWAHAQLPSDPPASTSLWRTWLARTEAPCGLDTDGDGSASIADLGAFLQWYGSGSPKADYHSDGVIDVQDVAAFSIDLGGP